MQTICISLETDNHTNTSSLNFYRPDALPDAHPSVKALKAILHETSNDDKIFIGKISKCTTKGKFKKKQVAAVLTAKGSIAAAT